MATAPTQYASALIESLRGGPQSLSNDIGLLDNGENGAGLSQMDLLGLLFNPNILRMPAGSGAPAPKVTRPTTPAPPAGGGGTSTVVLDLGGKKSINTPKSTGETGGGDSRGGGTGPTLPAVAPIDVPVVPAGTPEVVPEAPTLPPGNPLPPIIPTVGTKPPKKDGSHWGEGGDQIYSDPDRVTSPYVDPIDTGNLRVINVDTQPLGTGTVEIGKGSDVQENPYNFGVLESDMDGLMALRDQINLPDRNGSDLQSDNYTFGVLQSDEDPEIDPNLLRFLLEYGG